MRRHSPLRGVASHRPSNEHVLRIFARWLVERSIIGAWLAKPEHAPGLRLGRHRIVARPLAPHVDAKPGAEVRAHVARPSRVGAEVEALHHPS